MSVDLLAVVREGDVNLLLFFHVAGAMATFGAVSVAAYYLVRAHRDSSAALARVGFRTLLIAAIPSWIVMRVFAQLLADDQGITDAGLDWINLGFTVSEGGLLILIATTVLAGLAARRPEGTSVRGGPRVAAWLLTALLVGFAVTVWAMAAKPA